MTQGLRCNICGWVSVELPLGSGLAACSGGGSPAHSKHSSGGRWGPSAPPGQASWSIRHWINFSCAVSFAPRAAEAWRAEHTLSARAWAVMPEQPHPAAEEVKKVIAAVGRAAPDGSSGKRQGRAPRLQLRREQKQAGPCRELRPL